MLFVNDIPNDLAAAGTSGPEDKEKKKRTEQDVDYRVNSGTPPPVDEEDETLDGPPFDWEWRPIPHGEPQGPYVPPNLPPWRVEFRVNGVQVLPGGVSVYDPASTVRAVEILGVSSGFAIAVSR